MINQVSLTQLGVGADNNPEKETKDLSEEIQGRLRQILVAKVWQKWRRKQQHREQVDRELLQNAQGLLATLTKRRALAQWKLATAVHQNTAIAEKTYSTFLFARTFGKWAGKTIPR